MGGVVTRKPKLVARKGKTERLVMFSGSDWRQGREEHEEEEGYLKQTPDPEERRHTSSRRFGDSHRGQEAAPTKCICLVEAISCLQN
jgi:hypothetical protein